MQAVKYKWVQNNGTMEPSMHFLGGSQARLDMMGRRISMSIGDRRCIGYFSGNRHVPCPENRLLDSGYNCNECRLNDDFFMCMKCDGSVCVNEKTRNNCAENRFFVYLAAFDSVIKVGISQQFRLMERLIEQGADFAAKIAAVKDGKDVRVIEQDIRSRLNIVDRLTGDQKHGLLFGSPNRSMQALVSSVEKLRNTEISSFMLPAEIYDLRSYYRLDHVPHEPKKIKIGNGAIVEGDVVAAKGNIVILKSADGYESFNAHDMIGRHVELRV